MEYEMVMSPHETTYSYIDKPGGPLTYIVLLDTRVDATSFCGCLRGFSPASPAAWEWDSRDTSVGCRRNVKLDCSGDGWFLAAARGEASGRAQRVGGQEHHAGGVTGEVPRQLLARGLRRRRHQGRRRPQRLRHVDG